MNHQVTKGSGEPVTRNTDSDVNLNAVTPCPETGYPSTVKFNGADVNDKGMFLPPEFIRFAKQLRYMRDWIDEYGCVRGVSYPEHYLWKTVTSIEEKIIDIADDIGTLARAEFVQTCFWDEPYCKCRETYDREKSNQS
jgi:hypothetical protein